MRIAPRSLPGRRAFQLLRMRYDPLKHEQIQVLRYRQGQQYKARWRTIARKMKLR